jgi:uncharacterized membrane protein
VAVWSRRACAAFFAGSGALHLLVPGPYRAIMPRYLPWHAALVALSGVAELAGGLGLLMPRARRAAGIGLLILLLAVFPANVEMLVRYREQGAGTFALLLLWLRLPLQGLLMWWVWRVSRPVR